MHRETENTCAYGRYGTNASTLCDLCVSSARCVPLQPNTARIKLDRFLVRPILHDLDERAPVQFLQRDAGGHGLGFGDGAAGDAAQEEVEQALAGGGVIEHVAAERGLGCGVDEAVQPPAGVVQALQEEV